MAKIIDCRLCVGCLEIKGITDPARVLCSGCSRIDTETLNSQLQLTRYATARFETLPTTRLIETVILDHVRVRVFSAPSASMSQYLERLPLSKQYTTGLYLTPSGFVIREDFARSMTPQQIAEHVTDLYKEKHPSVLTAPQQYGKTANAHELFALSWPGLQKDRCSVCHAHGSLQNFFDSKLCATHASDWVAFWQAPYARTPYATAQLADFEAWCTARWCEHLDSRPIEMANSAVTPEYDPLAHARELLPGFVVVLGPATHHTLRSVYSLLKFTPKIQRRDLEAACAILQDWQKSSVSHGTSCRSCGADPAKQHVEANYGTDDCQYAAYVYRCVYCAHRIELSRGSSTAPPVEHPGTCKLLERRIAEAQLPATVDAPHPLTGFAWATPTDES